MANVDGKATALTVISPIMPYLSPVVRAVLFFAQKLPGATTPVAELKFIHYARWTVFGEIPYNGEPQQREDLPYDHLFFESNFNGLWDEYIDEFSEAIPLRMRAVWQTSYGFPGPNPSGPFKDYIRRNDFPVQHYYSAYPHAACTEINSALRVRDAFASLRERASSMSARAFDRAWAAFLTDVQSDL